MFYLLLSTSFSNPLITLHRATVGSEHIASKVFCMHPTTMHTHNSNNSRTEQTLYTVCCFAASYPLPDSELHSCASCHHRKQSVPLCSFAIPPYIRPVLWTCIQPEYWICIMRFIWIETLQRRQHIHTLHLPAFAHALIRAARFTRCKQKQQEK